MLYRTHVGACTVVSWQFSQLVIVDWCITSVYNCEAISNLVRLELRCSQCIRYKGFQVQLRKAITKQCTFYPRRHKEVNQWQTLIFLGLRRYVTTNQLQRKSLLTIFYLYSYTRKYLTWSGWHSEVKRLWGIWYGRDTILPNREGYVI